MGASWICVLPGGNAAPHREVPSNENTDPFSCIRAFPADSREYFGEIADGNTPRAPAAVRFTAALPGARGRSRCARARVRAWRPADGAPVVPGALMKKERSDHGLARARAPF